MRVAKLTIDGYYNYGNLLQSYALQEVLERLTGAPVDTLWHEPDNFLPRVQKDWTWRDAARFALDRHQFRRYVGEEMVRQGKFKDWADRYLHIRMGTDFSRVGEEYDFFVAGSDQIWNPNFGDLSHNFLSFAPREKRIAYAASIASPAIPADKQGIYREGISGIPSVSVREQQAAAIVKELTGREVPVVVDPTMLLTPEDWRRVSRRPAWYHGGDYVFSYFLSREAGEPPVVDALAEQAGLPVRRLFDETDYDTYVTGVDEFLWAIEHARLVCTDSFHASVFSVLFRVPFLVCERRTAGADAFGERAMSSRLDTLLGMFHLEGRRARAAQDWQIDDPFSLRLSAETEEILARERGRALSFLRTALQLQEMGGGSDERA